MSNRIKLGTIIEEIKFDFRDALLNKQYNLINPEMDDGKEVFYTTKDFFNKYGHIFAKRVLDHFKPDHLK